MQNKNNGSKHFYGLLPLLLFLQPQKGSQISSFSMRGSVGKKQFRIATGTKIRQGYMLRLNPRLQKNNTIGLPEI